MGPEGGNRGGFVVAEGTPEEVAGAPGQLHRRSSCKPLLADNPARAAGRQAGAPRSPPQKTAAKKAAAKKTTAAKKATGEEDDHEEGTRRGVRVTRRSPDPQ